MVDFDNRAVQEAILGLLERSRALLNRRSIQHVMDYVGQEEEMALESLCLDLMDRPEVPLADLEEMARLCKMVGLDRESVYDPDFWTHFTEALEEQRKRGATGGQSAKAVRRRILRLARQNEALLGTKELRWIFEDCDERQNAGALEGLCLGLVQWPETPLVDLEEMAQLCLAVGLDEHSTVDPNFWQRFLEILEERLKERARDTRGDLHLQSRGGDGHTRPATK